MKRLALCMLVFAACSDDAPVTPDAPPDPCAPQMQVTGEYVDWDSTDGNFKGVPGTKFILQGDATKSASTAPNGRFIMPCLARADALLTVEPMPASGYVPGVVVVNKAVIETGAMLSYRSFTMTRAADFGYDASKAGVFVNIAGTPRAVSVSSSGTSYAFDGNAWAQGNSGKHVYFAGISPGTAMVTMSGTTVGTGSVEVAAGSITFLTIVAR